MSEKFPAQGYRDNVLQDCFADAQRYFLAHYLDVDRAHVTGVTHARHLVHRILRERRLAQPVREQLQHLVGPAPALGPTRQRLDQGELPPLLGRHPPERFHQLVDLVPGLELRVGGSYGCNRRGRFFRARVLSAQRGNGAARQFEIRGERRVRP